MVKRRKVKIFLREHKIALIVVSIIIFSTTIRTSNADSPVNHRQQTPVVWQIRSIDTMKTSRDNARAELYNPEYDKEIQKELSEIKQTGANYVAIDTPYDNEFLPYLKRWVTLARQIGLHVWFRGNWSNWEGWFGYPKNMSPDEHIQKNTAFIKTNSDLFQNGDIFDPCPECENAGFWPQPDKNKEYLAFLQQQEAATKLAFKTIGKNVYANIVSVIGGRAKDMFDKKTVNSLDRVISIDHYFQNPQTMSDYVSYFAKTFKAKVVVSEFGAPIPDFNGDMSDVQQGNFVNNVFMRLYQQGSRVLGVNYWVIKGGTTGILRSNNLQKPVYDIIKNFYSPNTISGKVINTLGNPVSNVEIKARDVYSGAVTDNYGQYSLAVPRTKTVVLIAGNSEYAPHTARVSFSKSGNINNRDFTLTPLHPSLFYQIRLFIKNFRI